MDKVVSEQAAVGTTWTWTAPATDYTGYLVDVYRTKENGTEVILGTIAVDVSSDWTRFPRYGFVATFDASKKGDAPDFLDLHQQYGIAAVFKIHGFPEPLPH